jgi:hypothetical protein
MMRVIVLRRTHKLVQKNHRAIRAKKTEKLVLVAAAAGHPALGS